MPKTLEKKVLDKKDLELSKIAVIAFKSTNREKESLPVDYEQSCKWSVCHCATFIRDSKYQGKDDIVY